MIRKIALIFTFVLLMFCMSEVQAFSRGDSVNPRKETFESLIETKVTESEETWENANFDKYSIDDAIIYKIGNKEEKSNEVYLQYLTFDAKVQRAIKNGYLEKNFELYGLSSDNELYMATKIALDCLENGKGVEDIDDFYRPKFLDDTKKTKAENIINAAKEILNIAINGKDTYSYGLGFGIVGEIQKDSVKERILFTIIQS